MHPLEDIGPHRAERLRQPAGIDEADAGGHRQALNRRRRGILAIPVADQQRADLVADPPLGDTIAGLDDRARTFEPGNVRRPGRHRIAPHPLQAIGAVDPGGGDPDQHFAGLRLGHGADCGHQHLGSARRLDLDHGLRCGDVRKHSKSFPRVLWLSAIPSCSRFYGLCNLQRISS
jgi:hypothetical protein